MRNRTFTISILTLLLSSVAACERRGDEGTETTSAAREPEPTYASGRPAQTEREHVEQGNEQLAAARDEYVRAGRERLDKIDARLQELEAETDAEARQAAMELRARRDALAADLDRAEDRTEAEWEEFESDLDARFEKLERDIDDAL